MMLKADGKYTSLRNLYNCTSRITRTYWVWMKPDSPHSISLCYVKYSAVNTTMLLSYEWAVKAMNRRLEFARGVFCSSWMLLRCPSTMAISRVVMYGWWVLTLQEEEGAEVCQVVEWNWYSPRASWVPTTNFQGRDQQYAKVWRVNFYILYEALWQYCFWYYRLGMK